MDRRDDRIGWSISQRERLELMVTALVPAAVGLLIPLIRWAGRAAWLTPWIVLPVGLLLCRAWERIGRIGLAESFKSVLGPFSRPAVVLYMLWGLFLLSVSVKRCGDRLLAAGQIKTSGWIILLTAFLLTVWLTGHEGRFTGTGRIIYLSTAVTLVLVGVLTLPSLRWENLIPVTGGKNDRMGLLPASGYLLSLSGYAVYGLCIPPKDRGEIKTHSWVIWTAAGISGLLLAVTGAFGPALAVMLEEPFLYILRGVGIPGAFQRGEAVLAAVLALSDLVLLGLLTRGCIRLWEKPGPGMKYSGLLWITGAFLLSAVLPVGEENGGWIIKTEVIGNMILGVFLPAALSMGLNRKEQKQDCSPSCGNTEEKTQDIEIKKKSKK